LRQKKLLTQLLRLISIYASVANFYVQVGVAIAIPFGIFLNVGLFWRYVVPCMLAPRPTFFAGLAGAVVAGLSESFSMLPGFRFLLLLAIGFYFLSMIPSPWKNREAKIKPSNE